MAKQTVAEFVKNLGGASAVAKLIGVSQPQVSNMTGEGRIPPKHYARLRDVCAARGIECPEHLFFDTPKRKRAA